MCTYVRFYKRMYKYVSRVYVLSEKITKYVTLCSGNDSNLEKKYFNINNLNIIRAHIFRVHIKFPSF